MTNSQSFTPTAAFAFAAAAMVSEIGNEPRNWNEAMKSSNKDKWIAASKEEYDSLEKHKVWEWSELPPSKKALDTKWVFKVKTNADGEAVRYKARLVARGFMQEQGIDFNETFAAVVKSDTWKLFFALVALQDLECDQVDITTAFLNGDLENDEIYVQAPRGYEQYNNGKKLYWRLRKTLYGLKQSARYWFRTMEKKLKKIGFSRSSMDHGLFYQNGVWILLYVDDLLIAARTQRQVNKVKLQIFETFDGKDLGPVSFFLGVKITRDRATRTIYLSQQGYIEKLLKDCGMDSCNTNNKSPLSKSQYEALMVPPPSEHRASAAERTEFQRMVGYILYAAMQTRVDMAFDIIALARYMSNPTPAAMIGIKSVLRYAAREKDRGIKISFGPKKQGTEELGLEIYCDSSYAADKASRRSHSGWVAMAGNGPIAWHTALQKTVSNSTCEAEYMEMSLAAQHASWTRQILKEFGYKGKDAVPTVIREDNNAAIQLAKNPEFHKRTKHIDVKWHYVRQEQEEGRVAVQYVSTQENKADGLTKPRDAQKQELFLEQLGMAKESMTKAKKGQN